MVFRRRHAGCRLVEQQKLRPLRQRDGDFDQPLAAIRQLAHRLAGVGDEFERFQMLERLIDDGAFARRGPPQAVAGAGALADRQIEIFEHGQAAEKLVDLERTGDAAPRARGLRKSA